MPGPAPQRSARRSNPQRGDWVKLPPERLGPAPEWPLPGDEPALWRQVWKLPQANQWFGKGLDLVIARYVLLSTEASTGMATAALLGEVRQMEDRLGLSVMAMKRLQWDVEDLHALPDGHAATVANLDDYRNL